jgi:hypothetical protein
MAFMAIKRIETAHYFIVVVVGLIVFHLLLPAKTVKAQLSIKDCT